MPDQTGPSATDTPLEKTLQALIPDLKAKRRLGWAVAAIVSVTTFGLTALLLLGVFKGDLPWIIVLPTIGVFSVIEINRRVARSQQALILPHLVKTVDLTYFPDAKAFFDTRQNGCCRAPAAERPRIGSAVPWAADRWTWQRSRSKLAERTHAHCFGASFCISRTPCPCLLSFWPLSGRQRDG